MCACTSVEYMYVGMSSSKAFNTHLMPAFVSTQYYAGTRHTVRNKHSTTLKDSEDNGNNTTITTWSVRAVLEIGRGLRRHQGAVSKCQGKLSGRDHAWSFPSPVGEQSLEAESMT